jgi:AraC family transcriptional regulator
MKRLAFALAALLVSQASGQSVSANSNPKVRAIPGRDQVRGGLPGVRLKKVLDYIEVNFSKDIHLNDLAQTAGLSAFHFAKLFKQSTALWQHWARRWLARRLNSKSAVAGIIPVLRAQIPVGEGTLGRPLLAVLHTL